MARFVVLGLECSDCCGYVVHCFEHESREGLEGDLAAYLRRRMQAQLARDDLTARERERSSPLPLPRFLGVDLDADPFFSCFTAKATCVREFIYIPPPVLPLDEWFAAVAKDGDPYFPCGDRTPSFTWVRGHGAADIIT